MSQTLFATVTYGTSQRLCEITNLFDVDGDETNLIDEAQSAVIKWDDQTWIAFSPAPGETMKAFVHQPT